MDEKIKTWPLRFPAKETLIWRRHCSIGQSCCSMTSKKFLESSSGMKFVYPRVRLANQNPGAFVSVSYTNQIALFPFVCCFCFVRAFSFQGHTKIALSKNATFESDLLKTNENIAPQRSEIGLFGVGWGGDKFVPHTIEASVK